MFGWITRNRWVLTIASAVVGIGLLVWSWLDSGDSWLSGVLVNAGTTLLLFAPLLLAGRHIESRLDEVRASQTHIEERQERAASDMATLAEEVSNTQAELRRTREQLSEAVVSRLAAVREKDARTFRNVEEMPSHGALFEALVRAHDLHLISSEGCRVPLANTSLYVWFDKPPVDRFSDEPDPTQDLRLQIEQVDCQQVSQLWWGTDLPVEDFLVNLAEAVQAAGYYPGDSRFEAGRIFSDLRELLELAHKGATGQGMAPLNGVVQYCPPQWVITEQAIVAVTVPGGYPIPFNRFNQPRWQEHMYEKTWIDHDSFDRAFGDGKELFEAGQLAVKPPGYVEPMAF